MRRLVVASAILAIFLAVPLGMAAAAPNPNLAVSDKARATAALEYLLAAQSPDGSIDHTIDETADFIIGAAATGYDPATLAGCGGGTSALSFLATKSDSATADAAQTGKAILAVVAAGGNPASFGGRDLSARLAALYHSATGAYGDGSTISQSYAILAVVASGGSVRGAATDKLVALQGPVDGSWTYSAVQESGGGGDSNSTAVALMALNAAGVHSANTAAFAYLATQQTADGGFAYSTAWGSASDADSDAQVLQALISAGEDPLGTTWSKGSGNALTAMRAAQGADGGFNYQTYGESAFTTREIPAALMRVPYAAAVHFTLGLSVPATSCPGSNPSPSASVTSSASASSSASAAHSTGPTHTPTRKPTVRPTVRPTAAPTATPTPTDTATATPTAVTTAPPTASAPEPTSQVAGETAPVSAAPAEPAPGSSGPGGSSGGIPAPLAYALAALAGLGAVAVGGWLLLMRPVKP